MQRMFPFLHVQSHIRDRIDMSEIRHAHYSVVPIANVLHYHV